MRRFLAAGLVAVACLSQTACQSCNDVAPAAGPQLRSAVYTPPCEGGNYSRPEGDPVYTPSSCDPLSTFVDGFKSIRCPVRGLGLPGLDCSAPEPLPAAPAAPLPEPSGCNPADLPKDAKPGQAWCCTWVQPPAAPPVQIMAEPARTEWVRVDCPPGKDSSDCCYRLVEVPARFETRYAAPPPGYWEWRLNPDCKVPVVPQASPCKPSN